MGKTKFYTVQDLMEMGKIRKWINTKTLFPITNDDKEQLAFAGAISPKMLFNLVEMPRSETIEESRPIKGQISIFSLGKSKNAKRNK